jgi:hypothetical protein
MPRDKLVTLEYDEETGEFRILALHNLENELDLEETGKKFPLRGKLRSNGGSIFGYVSDDYKWVHISLKTPPP